MAEGYIGDPVKRKAREEKYRRMYAYWAAHDRDVTVTAHWFNKPCDTIRRAISFCEKEGAA